MPIKYRVKETDVITILEFEIDGGVMDVSELPAAIQNAPEVNLSKGIGISGRGPIWLYSALTHHYHPALFISVHDPRLGGFVVVATHTKEKHIGEIIHV